MTMVGSQLLLSKAHVFESLFVTKLERSKLCEGLFFGGSLFVGLVLKGFQNSLMGCLAFFQLILKQCVLTRLKFNFLATDNEVLLKNPYFEAVSLLLCRQR